jgi:hypothetical protein
MGALLRNFNTRYSRFHLLITLLLFGVCFMTAAITWHLAFYVPDKHEFLEWLALPESIAMLFLFAILVSYGLAQLRQDVSAMFDEAIDSMVSGIVIFEADGRLNHFNRLAEAMIPALSGGGDRSVETYKSFLAYVYDHSLDIQDQSQMFSQVDPVEIDTASGPTRLSFREVMQMPDGTIVLAQFYQRPQGEIAVSLTDVSMMKRHIDEMSQRARRRSGTADTIRQRRIRRYLQDQEGSSAGKILSSGFRGIFPGSCRRPSAGAEQRQADRQAGEYLAAPQTGPEKLRLVFLLHSLFRRRAGKGICPLLRLGPYAGAYRGSEARSGREAGDGQAAGGRHRP